MRLTDLLRLHWHVFRAKLRSVRHREKETSMVGNGMFRETRMFEGVLHMDRSRTHSEVGQLLSGAVRLFQSETGRPPTHDDIRVGIDSAPDGLWLVVSFGVLQPESATPTDLTLKIAE